MNQKRVALFLLTFIVTLQVFNGILFGFNLNLSVLQPNEAELSLNISGVSNVTAISDVYGWNDDDSWESSIAVDDSGNVHVVWEDYTDGEWGTDDEIMYANYTVAGWSNATAISDIYGWNNGNSGDPSVAVDGSGNVHVAWEDSTDGEWGSDQEIMYANYTATGWSNATVISDDYTGWNNGTSSSPNVAVDDNGNVHVVWMDATNGEWGADYEIMYANYTASGWSNATAISDLYGWNDGDSDLPSVAVDSSGNVHVVWQDNTIGEWGGGSDAEIMYANYTATGWSNATVISDDYTGWNDDYSYNPSFAVDGSGTVHVVWEDYTYGEWGTDEEIMYTKCTATGWSNATVISDLYGWNDGGSYTPSIAADGSGNVHVVWEDHTDGWWGTDGEIMYAKCTAAGWSNATVISDDYTGWNDADNFYPSVAVDSSGNVHVVWEDDTDGGWGTDWEIMYVKISAEEGRFPMELLLLILDGAQPGLMEQLPLILVGIGVAVIVVIIVVVKKRQ